MLQKATQAHRQLAINTDLGQDVLLLEQFVGQEAISELSEFKLRLVSNEGDIDPFDLLGTNTTFLVDLENAPPRYFNGIVSSFGLTDRNDEMYVYEMVVRPWLWMLTQNRDCRIFQNVSCIEIIQEIFNERQLGAFDDRLLSREYAKREYCVQYQESDFDFVSRLMEEEGIFYVIQHENGSHTVTLADHSDAYFEVEDNRVSLVDRVEQGVITDDVTQWQHIKQTLTGRCAAIDYNYRKPSRPDNSETGLYCSEPSAISSLSDLNLEQFYFPGRYREKSNGDALTQVRMESIDSDFEWVSSEGVRWSFTPGALFEVESHPNPVEVGQRYAIRRISYTAGSVGGYRPDRAETEQPWVVSFEAIPSHIVFRPRQQTPRPIIVGPQTAKVVGTDGEEIYTDPEGHARVKVQFHWDRRGEHNENSSCWLRASQVHAGAGFGAIDIPRIDEEVIVSFIEGDPDQPIIKGRVYNRKTTPPFGLPASKTTSGIKSDSYRGSGFNQVSVDDMGGKERLFTNAQKDMDSSVGNNQSLLVGANRSADVVNNDSLKVGVNRSVEVGSDLAETIGSNEDIIVGSNIEIDAGVSLTLKCGASTIHMNQAGVITISGQYVSSLAKATNTIVAPMTEVAGSNMLNQAGLICLDLAGIKHIKGAETAVNGATVAVEGGLTVIKGAPIKIGEAGAPIASIPAPSSGSSSGSGGPDSPTGSGGGGSEGEAAGDGGDVGDAGDLDQTSVDQPGESSSPDDQSADQGSETPSSESSDGRTGATPGPDGENESARQSDDDQSSEGGSNKDLDKLANKTTKQSTKTTKEIAKQDDLAQRAAADEAKANAESKANRLEAEANDLETKAQEAGERVSKAERNVAETAQGTSNAEHLESQKAASELDVARQDKVVSDVKASEGRVRADQARADAQRLPSGDDLSTSAGKAAKAADVLGKSFDVVTAAQGAAKATEQIQQGDYRGASVTTGETVGDIGGGWAGAAAGAKAGAVTGAFICGPACAVVGGFVGGVAGGYAGSTVGKELGGQAGGAIHDYATQTPNATPNPSPVRVPISANPATSLPIDIRPTCFAAGTPVLTPHGLQPIETILPGDFVHCLDGNQDIAVTRVVETSEAHVNAFRIIEFDDDLIITTDRHRWFIQDAGWCEAGTIKADDCCVSIHEESPVVVESRAVRESTRVFNLELETHHNFLVGQQSLLVHNGIK